MYVQGSVDWCGRVIGIDRVFIKPLHGTNFSWPDSVQALQTPTQVPGYLWVENWRSLELDIQDDLVGWRQRGHEQL